MLFPAPGYDWSGCFGQGYRIEELSEVEGQDQTPAHFIDRLPASVECLTLQKLQRKGMRMARKEWTANLATEELSGVQWLTVHEWPYSETSRNTYDERFRKLEARSWCYPSLGGKS